MSEHHTGKLASKLLPLAALAGLLGACDVECDSAGPWAMECHDVQMSSLRIRPADDSLRLPVGGTTVLTADLLDAQGNLVHPVAVHVAVTNSAPRVLKVDSDTTAIGPQGFAVTALAPGRALVTLRVEHARDSVVVVVR